MLLLLNDLKFLIQRSPSYLIFWVAQTCNFTCDHCFNYLENQKKRKELTLEEVDRFSRNLDHLKYVTFAGGEPLIRRDLSGILEVFYLNNGLQIANVVTNGWFTDRTVDFAERVLKKCPGLHLSINISIDGFREQHDHIRQKRGSFDRCISTIKALKDLQNQCDTALNLSVSSSGVYTSENAQEIFELGCFMIDTQNIPYYLNLIRGEDIQNNELKFVDLSHYQEVYQELLGRNQKVLSADYPFRRVKLAVNSVLSEIIMESAQNNRMTVPCKAGEKGFVIKADGQLLLCEILDIELGNIRDHGYDPLQVLSSDFAKKEMARIVEERCHCTWECFQSMNIVFSPQLYPRVVSKVVGSVFDKDKSTIVGQPDPNKGFWRPNSLIRKE